MCSEKKCTRNNFINRFYLCIRCPETCRLYLSWYFWCCAREGVEVTRWVLKEGVSGHMSQTIPGHLPLSLRNSVCWYTWLGVVDICVACPVTFAALVSIILLGHFHTVPYSDAHSTVWVTLFPYKRCLDTSFFFQDKYKQHYTPRKFDGQD
jgi:hypothetical protein